MTLRLALAALVVLAPAGATAQDAAPAAPLAVAGGTVAPGRAPHAAPAPRPAPDVATDEPPPRYRPCG